MAQEGYFEYSNFEFENGNFEKQSGELKWGTKRQLKRGHSITATVSLSNLGKCM